ncbi:hypothetical protein ACWEO4_26430 [Streptomyces sp. NPDC004393]
MLAQHADAGARTAVVTARSHRGGCSPAALRRTYACGISTSRGSASRASRTGPFPSAPDPANSATISARAATGSGVTVLPSPSPCTAAPRGFRRSPPGRRGRAARAVRPAATTAR